MRRVLLILTRTLVVGIAVGALVAWGTRPARATAIERCRPLGCVAGEVTVSGDETRWNLRVSDTRADGYCVYAKVEIDVDSGLDPDFRSENACPQGGTVTFAGADNYAGTQGARIYLCRNDGMCAEVHYEGEG